MKNKILVISMKRISIIMAILTITCFTLTGCSVDHNPSEQTQITPQIYQEVELSNFTRGRVEYLGLLSEDSILYYDPSSRRTDYYIYNFSTKENR